MWVCFIFKFFFKFFFIFYYFYQKIFFSIILFKADKICLYLFIYLCRYNIELDKLNLSWKILLTYFYFCSSCRHRLKENWQRVCVYIYMYMCVCVLSHQIIEFINQITHDSFVHEWFFFQSIFSSFCCLHHKLKH